MDPIIVDIRMILDHKLLMLIKYISISAAAVCTVINSTQSSHPNLSITPEKHQWSGAAPLLNRREVQMMIGV